LWGWEEQAEEEEEESKTKTVAILAQGVSAQQKKNRSHFGSRRFWLKSVRV